MYCEEASSGAGGEQKCDRNVAELHNTSGQADMIEIGPVKAKMRKDSYPVH
jgi:hypothetical protein